MDNFTTADLCDRFASSVNLQIAEPQLKTYGAKHSFSGAITTIKVFENNAMVKTVLQESGTGRVMVIDGGGSHRCALFGADLAQIALDNDWQGIVVYGCIRDADTINQLPIGLRALHTHPLISHKSGLGDRDQLITFAGVNFKKDHFLYADNDGIIVSETLLR
jgi:regulator of ribonuclease activity A